MQISTTALKKIESRYSGMKNRLANVKKEAEKTAMTVVDAGEVVGTAFALGVVNGRFSNPEPMGIPVDLGVGIAAHVLGFVVDDGERHLHNLGNGALAVYFGSLGAGVGQKMLSDRSALTPT